MPDMPEKGFTHYTEEELEIIRENAPNKTLPQLLKLLPNRSYDGIDSKLQRMGLKASGEKLMGYSLGEITKLSGIHADVLRCAIERKKLKAKSVPTRTKLRKKYFVLEEDLRAWVVQSRPGKIGTCIVCRSKVRGDIFCNKDLPTGYKPKDELPESKTILVLDVPKAQCELGQVHKRIRKIRALSKKKVSCSYLSGDPRSVRDFEEGNEKFVSLDKIHTLFKLLGYRVKITVERII